MLDPTLSIITCHPDSPDVPVLRNSLEKTIGWHDTELIPVVGKEGICKAYNQGAKAAQGKHFLFVHSDVEFMSPRILVASAIKVLDRSETGVVGVAGTRLLNHDCVWWRESKMLSGACLHTDKDKTWCTSFGPYGRVVVLDGVLLMVSRATFEKLGGFPEWVPGYDFYDIEFTLRSHMAGFINQTFPFHVLHRSMGERCLPKSPDDVTPWEENRRAFIERWKSKLPVSL